MENCKADNIAEKFFTEVTGNKGLSVNSCFVDVGAIRNTSLKQVRSKIPTASAVEVVSTELHP